MSTAAPLTISPPSAVESLSVQGGDLLALSSPVPPSLTVNASGAVLTGVNFVGSAAASASAAAPSLGPGWHFSDEQLWNGTGPSLTDVQQSERAPPVLFSYLR